jgi:hypothetical protein
MSIFHAIGKLDLTILVSNSRVVKMTENVFYAMFAFRQGSMHISKDVSYWDDNINFSYVYQVQDVNFGGML